MACWCRRRTPWPSPRRLPRSCAIPSAQRLMGERARERRAEEFDVAVAANRIGALYARLYAASKRGGEQGGQVEALVT